PGSVGSGAVVLGRHMIRHSSSEHRQPSSRLRGFPVPAAVHDAPRHPSARPRSTQSSCCSPVPASLGWRILIFRRAPMTGTTSDFRLLHQRLYDNILQTTCNTPLVRLNRVIPAGGAAVYAKCEYFNPMASVKDRIGKAMIDAAERD